MIKRILTLVTAFSCAIVGVSLLQAGEPGSLSLKDLAVPETLGKVESRHPGQSSRWVIHIQDIHAHFAAQENIAAIVDHLNSVYGLQVVALEGGWKQASFPKSRELPSSPEKQEVARALLEKDYLTGPGYAAIFSQTPLQLIGVEEETLYEQDLALFVEHLSRRENLMQKLKTRESALKMDRTATFNPDLITFDEALREYREEARADKFLPFMMALAQMRGIDLSAFPQLALFKKIYEAEQKLDRKRLQSEANRILNHYQERKLSFEEMLRSGRIPEEQLKYYPATGQYLNLIELQDRLHLRRLMEEADQAIEKLLESLIQSPEEKALAGKISRFQTAKKVLMFKATPEDLDLFLKKETLIRNEMPDLKDDLDMALKFYELAQKRDEIFFRKIMQNPALTGDIAVVAGGFHTAGLSRQFEEAGVSYIVITPDLAGEEMNEKLYFDRLREENRPEIQTIAARLRHELPTHEEFDEAFAQAVRIRSETRDLNKALSLFESGAAQPVQKSEVISDAEFLELPEKEQRALVVSWIESDQPAAMFSMQNNFIFDTPLGHAVAELIIANRANKPFLAVPPGELPDDLMIGARNVLTTNAATLNEAMQQRKFSRPLQDYREQNVAGAISTDEDIRNQGFNVVIAPDEIAPFILGVLLRGDLRLSEDSGVRTRFYNTVRDIMMTLEVVQQFLKAA